MKKKTAHRHHWIWIPFIIITSLLTLPLFWMSRILRGRSLSPKSLPLNAHDMQLLEQASHDQTPLFINDRKYILHPFTAKEKHIHASCETCPDELHLNDTNGRACLSASREPSATLWHTIVMKPLLWGILGYVSDDLYRLRLGDHTLGDNKHSPSS